MNNLSNKLFLDSGNTYRVVPLLLICIYPFLVIADIYLTFLGTPDLKYESNLIIKALNIGWLEIISGASIFVVSIIILTIKANKVFIKHNTENVNYKNTTEILFSDVIVFYFHFVSSLFVIANNYLDYVYLYAKTDSILKELSIKYVHFYQQDILCYNMFMYSVLFLIGLSIAILRLRKLEFSTKSSNPSVNHVE